MPSHLLLPLLYFVIADTDRLSVHAEPAVARIAEQQDGRRLIRLPDLEFDMRISVRCAAGRSPDAVSISIADTRKSISGEQLLSNRPLQTSILVASRQVAPVAVQGFCVAGNPGPESVVIRMAMTAHASLRCKKADSRSIVFDAEPLDVRVVCDVAGDSTSG